MFDNIPNIVEIIENEIEEYKKTGLFPSRNYLINKYGITDRYAYQIQGIIKYEISKQNINNNYINNRIKAVENQNKRFYDITNLIINSIKDNIKTIDVPKIYKPEIQNSHIILNVLLSDIHYGEKINKDEVIDLNEYNNNIAIKYLNRYKKQLYLLSKMIKPKEINLFLLGDLVSGIIHEELLQYADGTILEQVLDLADKLTEFILQFAQEFNINVYCFYGNHGRLTKQYKHKKAYVNYDTFIYEIIKRRIPDLNIYIYKDIYNFIKIGKTYALVLHGNVIRSMGMTPYTAIIKFIDRAMHIANQKGIKVDYVLMGHFHNVATINHQFLKVIINGSFVGINEYGLHKQLLSNPEQIFFTTDENGELDTISIFQLKY